MMDSSPSKRRKTSPTTSVPGNAPTTPSRIPVRRLSTQPLSGRPSFASPTKASISKHHPQLLNRPSSAGTGAQRPRSRGKDIQDLFARALGEPRPSIEGNTTPLGPAFEPATPRAGSGHRRVRSDGGGLSAKPRRMSRSPIKKTPKPFEQQKVAVDEMQENINPFVKRGLRRSPVGQPASQTGGVLQDLQEQNVNPFEKRGLRRSPVSSQAAEAAGELLGWTAGLAQASRTEPVVLNAVDTLPNSDPPPDREEDHFTTQSTEPITINSSDTRFPLNPQISENVEPAVQRQDGRRSRSTSRRRGRSSEVAEPAAQVDEDQPQDTRPSSRERDRVSEAAEAMILPTQEQNTTEPQSTSRQRGHASEEAEESLFVPKQPQKPEPRPTLRRVRRASEAAEPITLPPKPQDNPKVPSNNTRPSLSSQAVERTIFGISQRHEEPELPPTPTQRGIADPVVTTPPTGIHDTPSKRARKKAGKQKSSPLKPKDPPPPVQSKTANVETTSKTQDKVRRRRSVRFLVPEDPHAAKKEARDNLLKELQQLRADVALANQENERISLLYESKKSSPKVPSNPEQLLDLLQRSTAPEPTSKPSSKPTSIFKSIGSFLPFNSRRKRQVSSTALSNKPIPSHLPIKVDDPLPYLQIFSPLTYSSNIILLPSESTSPDASMEERPILQRHLINASHPSGLFSAHLSMTVDSHLLSIVSLDIERLPANAEKELGTFLRERSNPDAVLNRDISVIGWAMARWVEVSIMRARFWCAVEHEFATPEARAKSLAKHPQRRKRKRQQMIDEDDVSDHDENEDGEKKQKWTIRQLLPQMGRTAMEIENEEVELRFEWRIGFDWTGEVESFVSATARLPKSWQNQDDRKSLKKIPDSFDRLVKERGPLSAVRAVIGLLMPS